MLRDLFLTDAEGLFLALFVDLLHAPVVHRGEPHHRAQGLDNGRILGHMVAVAAVGNFKALRGLHDDLVAGPDLQSVGGEEIALAPVFKFYTYNFNQFQVPLFLIRTPR